MQNLKNWLNRNVGTFGSTVLWFKLRALLHCSVYLKVIVKISAGSFTVQEISWTKYQVSIEISTFGKWALKSAFIHQMLNRKFFCLKDLWLVLGSFNSVVDWPTGRWTPPQNLAKRSPFFPKRGPFCKNTFESLRANKLCQWNEPHEMKLNIARNWFPLSIEWSPIKVL